MDYDIESALRACGNDMNALEYLYRQLYTQVCAVCYSALGDYDLAADSAQDAFLRLPDAAAGYRYGTNPKAFIMKVAYNCARDNRRKFRRTVPLPDRERSDGGRTESTITSRLYVEGLLSSLPEKQRVVLVMNVYGEMSVSEIASSLGIHKNTVRKRIQRAKDTLRESITNDTSGAKRVKEELS